MKPNSETQRSSSVNGQVKTLFRRKPLLERLAPVMGELLLSLVGGTSRRAARKPLPEYCYNIFKVLRKTYCKNLPDLGQLAQGGPKATDWEAWGKLIGAGLRCLRFGEADMAAIMSREALSLEDAAQLSAMVCTMPWLTEKSELSSSRVERRFDAEPCRYLVFCLKF